MKFDSFHFASLLLLAVCFALRDFQLGTPAGLQPYPRHDYGHALIDDDWYLFGGSNQPAGLKFIDMWKFNFISKVWTSIFLKPGSPSIFPRERFAYIHCNGSRDIYMYGGRTDVWEADLWKFNVDKGSFSQIVLPEHDPLTHPSLMCRTVNVTSPILYGFGGNLKANGDTFWSYDLTTKAFALFAPSALSNANMPGPDAKNGKSYRLAFIADPAQRFFEFYSLYREQPWTRVYFDTWDVLVPAGSKTHDIMNLTATEKYPTGRVLYGLQTAVASNGDIYLSSGWDDERSVYAKIDTIFKYTFATQSWSEWASWEAGVVPPRSNLPITRMWRDEVFVMAPGWGAEVYNDFYTFNISSNVTTKIHPNMIFPSARGGQCSVTVGEDIYYFGGSASNGDMFADLWKFNAPEASWTQVTSNSVDQPEGRSLHSCALIATLLYVFGGTNGEKELGDLWVFDVIALTWARARLIEESPVPTARANQLSFSYNEEFWIFGGAGAGKNFKDMWRYSAALETWVPEKYQADPSPGPLRAAGHTMLNGKLFVYGGYSNALIDGSSWLFDPSNKTWEKLPGSPVGISEVARGAVVASGSKVLVWGGEYYLAMEKSLLLFESVPRRWSRLLSSGVDNIGRASFSMNTVGSKVYIFGGYGASSIGTISLEKVLGDTYVMELPITKGCTYTASGPNPPSELENPVPVGSHVLYTRRGTLQGQKTDLGWHVKFANPAQETQNLPLSYIVESPEQLFEGAPVTVKQGALVSSVIGTAYSLRTDWDNTLVENVAYTDLSVDPGCFECAPGSVLTPEGTCSYCLKGQFWENGACLNCSAGLYGPLAGASSRGLCLPCPSGFYCPVSGSSRGIPCPKGQLCPSGARSGITATDTPPCGDECWILPQQFQDRADEMKAMNNIFGYIVVFFLLVSIVLTSFAIKLDRTPLFRFLAKCDIWDDKDSIGGTYTLAFVVAILFVVLSFVIPFIMDNIQENSVLLPVFKLRTAANFTVTVTFALPLGIDNCALENVVIEPWFEADAPAGAAVDTKKEADDDEDDGPAPIISTEVMKTISETANAADSCTVVWYCSYCHLTPTANLIVKIKDSETVLVGANKIEYIVNTTAAYPDQDSVVNGTLVPDPQTDVFRGAPSLVHLAALPTLHEILFNATEDTGLHISRARADTLGEMVDSSGFVKTLDTSIEFMFTKSINYLRITVSLKMSGAVLFALLLGLYAGLEGFFSSMASQTHIMLEMFGWEGDPPVEEEEAAAAEGIVSPHIRPNGTLSDGEDSPSPDFEKKDPNGAEVEMTDVTVEAGKKAAPTPLDVSSASQADPRPHATSDWVIQGLFWFLSVVAYILPFLFMFALLEE